MRSVITHLSVILLLITAPHAAAAPRPELPSDFWPSYLQPVAATLSEQGHCAEDLAKLPRSSRTVAPERFHLLSALCALAESSPISPETREVVLKELDQALAVRGADTTALVLKGLLLQESGKLEKARECFDDALWFGRPGGYSEGFVTAQLASIYNQLGQPAKANELWSRSLGSSPDNLESRLNLIAMAKSQGGLAQARALVEAGLNLHPDSPELQVQLSELILAAPDRTFGREAIERARQLGLTAARRLEDQDQLPGPSADSLLVRAKEAAIRALIEQGQLPAARRELAEAKKRHPNQESLSTLAEQLAVEEAAAKATPLAESPKGN